MQWLLSKYPYKMERSSFSCFKQATLSPAPSQAHIIPPHHHCHQFSPLYEELVVTRGVHFNDGLGNTIFSEVFFQQGQLSYIAEFQLLCLTLAQRTAKILAGGSVAYRLIPLCVKIYVVSNLIVFGLAIDAVAPEICAGGKCDVCRRIWLSGPLP